MLENLHTHFPRKWIWQQPPEATCPRN